LLSGSGENTGEESQAVIRIEAPLGITTELELFWTLRKGFDREPAIGLPQSLPRHLQVYLTTREIEDILAQPLINQEAQAKLLLKHGLYKLLSQICNYRLPWGILTGIRPGKIMHNLYDQGFSEEKRAAILEKQYAIRPDKIELLQKIAAVQRPYLEELGRNPQRVAIYISIPFCPSRCTYCSFPAFSLSKERQELVSYLQILEAEIQEAGLLAEKFALVPENIYLGGGTPTILTPQEMGRLLREIKKRFPWQECREFTVEAGRVDTLSLDMLKVLRQYGVTRLSINPQTMQDNTLVRVGRAHSVAEVKHIYQLARKLSDWIINMDLILGLPGEGLRDIQDTLYQVADLQPDNLTMHILALKRGSREFEMGFKHKAASEMEKMQEFFVRTADSWGLQPYYLYRQKRIAGNLENIGYAKPGLACLYNISVIEERQSILGLGAGASTKIIDPGQQKLFNFHHPVSWRHYLQKWRENHRRWLKVLEGSRYDSDK
jgi:oxygen-independent coproporphyrinogen-3 oxidase